MEMPDLGGIADSAKEMLGGSDAADGVVDQAAEAAKNVAPDQLDGAIDAAAEQAKGVLGG